MQNLCAIFCLLAVVLAGCASKSKSQARERQAYLAGQKQAFAQAADAQRINIRFVGPVRQSEVVWQDGLTLIQAIGAAGYNDFRDPRVITIIRQRERVTVDPRDVRAGKDFPLEPGDTVEILP